MHYNHQLHDWVLQNKADGMSEFENSIPGYNKYFIIDFKGLRTNFKKTPIKQGF